MQEWAQSVTVFYNKKKRMENANEKYPLVAAPQLLRREAAKEADREAVTQIETTAPSHASISPPVSIGLLTGVFACLSHVPRWMGWTRVAASPARVAGHHQRDHHTSTHVPRQPPCAREFLASCSTTRNRTNLTGATARSGRPTWLVYDLGVPTLVVIGDDSV